MGWLDVKPIAGDTALITTTATSILERWRKAARKRLPELLDSAKARLDEFGRLQYVNQPDIKEARGGLRDSCSSPRSPPHGWPTAPRHLRRSGRNVCSTYATASIWWPARIPT